MWRDRRRHRKALNLIDHLPGHSAYVEALSNDPETAAAVAEGHIPIDEDAEPEGPRLSEWSPERAALADVIDRLGVLIGAVIASSGSKPPKFTPTPRPDTAMAHAFRVARRRRVRQDADAIARLFAPHAFTDDPADGG